MSSPKRNNEPTHPQKFITPLTQNSKYTFFQNFVPQTHISRTISQLQHKYHQNSPQTGLQNIDLVSLCYWRSPLQIFFDQLYESGLFFRGGSINLVKT